MGETLRWDYAALLPSGAFLQHSLYSQRSKRNLLPNRWTSLLNICRSTKCQAHIAWQISKVQPWNSQKMGAIPTPVSSKTEMTCPVD